LNVLGSLEINLEKIYSKEIRILGLIILAAVIFRIIITPWNLPSVAPDVVVFFTEAFNFSHNNYDFFNSRFLWPLVLSLFFRVFEFETYTEYVNLIRLISIGLSVSTIPIVYFIAKQFVEKKYSILASLFFAFSIHIIENSTWGITEPLFLLLSLGSIYCMLRYNSKYTMLSFIFAALAFDTRLNGIVILIIILLGYSMKIRSKKKLLFIFLIGISIFTIISIPHYYDADSEAIPIMNRFSSTVNTNENNLSPHLLQTAKIFLNDEQLNPNSDKFHKITLLENYFFAIIKESYHFIIINVQFLIFLLPIGLFFIFKNRIWKEYLLILGIIISIIIAIPQYTLSAEIRNLLLILPLSSIIGIIGLEKILTNVKRKNVILTIIIFSLIISSIVILYPKTDNELITEKEMFGKYVSENYSGKITGDLLYHVENNLFDLNSIPLKYKEGKGIKTDFPFFTLFNESQFTNYLKNNKISYVIIDNQIDNRYPIFEEIFDNDEKYPYLIKSFDSNQEYEKLKVKIFKVNFQT